VENKLHQLLTEEQPRISNDLSLPRYLKRKINSIINCRTMNLGGHIHFCPDLHGGLFLFNSCKTRGCPVCMEVEQLKWFFKQRQKLLPVRHNHLVFKIPYELTHLWQYNKYLFQTIMFDAAKYAVKKVNRDIASERGWISVLHTAGGDLSNHLHLHVLITEGGFCNNEKWLDISLDVDSLRKYYEKSIKKKLFKALNKNKLDMPPGINFNQITKLIQFKKFNIHQVGIYTSGEGVLKYFSKKLKTGPLNKNQLISYDNNNVTFYYMREGKKEIVKLKRKEFIRRYLNHLPLKGFRIVRNYGLYSTRQTKLTKELKEKTFNAVVEEKVYSPEIPKCPVCGKELLIVYKYSAGEFKKLFALMKEGNPDRPPPVQYEFVRNKCLYKTQ